MKNLLVLPLIVLTVCVFAEDRVLIGSIERERTERDDSAFDSLSIKNGFGARIYGFRDSGLYVGAGFAHLKGDSVCELARPIKHCTSADVVKTRIFGEIGREIGNWTPFVGTSLSRLEVEARGESKSEEGLGINVGLWLELDRLKLRGAITDLDESDNRAISGNLLVRLKNNYFLGIETVEPLRDESNGYGWSIQFGKTF